MGNPASAAIHADETRVRATGRFLFDGGSKLYVRGVTYGTFRPRSDGAAYPDQVAIERDFRSMADQGLNAVRVYTIPPVDLLDAARDHGLHVMVGIPWEQHTAFLDDPDKASRIERQVRRDVERCAGHPAVLCYAIGNEIPASIVRWTGRRRIERHLRRLYEIVKSEDPGGLVTYGNFPPTEYLDLSFLDLHCFNVYLEDPAQLDAYLARLHHIAGDRPLILGEVGLDSLRNGDRGQARALEAQVEIGFESGCAGAFVFAWTDEWHRSGVDVRDWRFGLTTARRAPKPALEAVRRAFARKPFRRRERRPRISVVVCAHNAEPTLRDCLDGLVRLDYPDYEIVVVDDGSTDGTAAIAREYPVRLVSTENRGLSRARNTGLAASTGEIVAYIDADAWPDPDWLSYLAAAFEDGRGAGIGGPNIAPAGCDAVQQAVANAPGWPRHVMLSDREAEHLPGCNMAFRRARLEEIGGFDPVFRVAGDDVDICWRLRDRGESLGFCPGAVVWHWPRSTVAAYWRQQVGYGRAEALLEAKWPEKYNAVGHVRWGGRVYGSRLSSLRRLGGRVYHGVWGQALFQSLEEGRPVRLWALTTIPEWYLALAAIAALGALGGLWPALLWAVPVLVAGLAATVAEAGIASRHARLAANGRAGWRIRGLIGLLHLVQPVARLRGRFSRGLTPWRRRAEARPVAPRIHRVTVWSERWRSADDRLGALEAHLRHGRVPALRGGPYARWDLEVPGGLWGCARLRAAIEEHGAGRQLVRYRFWPRVHPFGVVTLALAAGLAVAALSDGAGWVSALLAAALIGIGLRVARDCSRALGALVDALDRERDAEGELCLVAGSSATGVVVRLEPDAPVRARSVAGP